MESYFFIPATKLKKLIDFISLPIQEFIIDFEDAIKASQRELLFSELIEIKESKKCYLRVPLHDLSVEEKLDLTFFKTFLDHGYKKFVFPKIKSLEQLDIVLKDIAGHDLEIILLIENPRIYLELLSKITNYSEKLKGLGLGSHDFMAIIGGRHTLKNLEVIRQNLLYMAKSSNLKSIDIASMEIVDEVTFQDEVKDGFLKGYDAKFIIHPKQFKLMEQIQFYTDKEYEQALKIDNEIKKIKNFKEFNPIIVDGQIVEQPHINLAKKILTNYKKNTESI
jgi:citrate lyase beta subunit